MLYAYPVQATANNWLHDCVGEILQLIHEKLIAGQLVPGWPDVIPIMCRARLNTRYGLRDRLNRYQLALSALTPEERERVFRAFNEENQIAHLLACACNCETIEDLPTTIRQPIRELFDYLFELLTGLGIRDEAYRVIYAAITYRVCAFCGVEPFDAPGAPREPFDHYLAQSQYPFASANLRNLVPMGHKCNSKYKLAEDILRTADGIRRRSFDPYGTVASIRISLSQSQPFAGKDGQIPAWNIEFEPDGEEVTTWDDVFQIRERYQRDILDEEFKTWLKHFSSWCRSANVALDGEATLLNALERYADFQEACGLSGMSFLQAAMFRMLLRHCQDGNDRLKDLLRSLSW